MKIKQTSIVIQRSRRFLWYLIVILLVLVAISLTLARLLIPTVSDFRSHIEVIVTRYLGQPLTIKDFDARIDGFTPVFIFKDVSLLERSTNNVMVRFKEARIGLSIYQSIKTGTVVPKSFVINGINLVVSQNKNKTFNIEGVDVAEYDPLQKTENADSNELSDWLFQQDKLKLENSTIHWHDVKANKMIKFSNINLQLYNQGDRHTLTGDWRLQNKIGKRFKIAMDLTGDILNPASWEGSAYIKGEEINITEFNIPKNLIPFESSRGIYNFEMWADFRKGQLREISGATNVRNLIISSKIIKDEIKITRIGGVWKWNQLADGWALNIDRFHYQDGNNVWPMSRLLVENHNKSESQAIIDIYVDSLDLEDTTELVHNLNILDDKTLQILQESQPEGRIDNAHIRFSLNDFFSDDFLFKANFLNISLNENAITPGIDGLKGSIKTSNQNGSVMFEATQSSFKFKKMFRDEIPISMLAGKFKWNYFNKEWHVISENLVLNNIDINTSSNLSMIFSEQRELPFIDLQVNFNNGNVSQTRKYLPVSIMDQELISWLDNSLRSGIVESGGVVLHGNLADFPFLKNNGKFEVNLLANSVEINYLKQWPSIYDANVAMTFSGSGVDIDIKNSKSFDAELKNTKILIKDFSNPELIVVGSAYTSTNDIFKFITNSPIAANSRSAIDDFNISGDSVVTIKINAPLSEAMNKTHSLYYSGSMNTSNSNISMYNNLVEFNNISGEILFDEKGFKSKKLTANNFGELTNINFYSQLRNNNYSHHILVQGKFSPQAIENSYKIPGLKSSSGLTNWQGIFNFPYSDLKMNKPASLVLTTDLVGIDLYLPKPLAKSTQSKLPITFEAIFDTKNNTNINLAISNIFSINSILDTRGDFVSLKSALINFDIVNKVKQQNNIVFVQGNVHDVNIDSWFKYIKAFNFSGNKNNNFFSEKINIVFDLDSYFITDPVDELKSLDETLAVEHSDKQKNTDEKSAFSEVDPRLVPEFSGVIRNIYYDKSKVGTLSFDFKRSKHGFDIKKLNVDSENFDLSSTGIWHIFPSKSKNRYLTKFNNVKFTSSNLGAALSSLGFKSILDNGKSNSDMIVWWHDSPFDFSVNKLSAEINVNISDGNLLTVEPGGAKLLGLLSISEIPKRLLGDFGDVFGSGLNFSTAIGKIRLANGKMTTKNMVIDTSLATITIEGETLLISREFNQHINVIPKVTNTVNFFAAIFGGPPGLVISNVIGNMFGIDDSTKSTYHITGTWKEPIITNINNNEFEKNDPNSLEDFSIDQDDT